MNHYLPPHSLQTAGFAAVKFRPDLADGLPGRKKGDVAKLFCGEKTFLKKGSFPHLVPP